MRLAPGNRLGVYEIVAPVGKGGMGEVYRAKDSRLNRQVAIKVLPEHLAQDVEALRRFEREAKTLAALSHPNIVTIHDVGTEQDTSYVVMELLEGETLRTRIAQSALPWEKALQIAVPVAEGLAAAHSKGVIHRDLKPENVFLTSDGRVKILDFGLARYQPPVAQEDVTESPTQSQVSAPGVVRGTVPYMSPEQVRAESLDARTDIFSFGCLLYETVTGQRAFRGETSAEVAAAILRDEPPGLVEIPAELNHILRHCLEKNPDQRFQSARDMAFDLQRVLANAGQFSGPAVELSALKRGRPRHRWKAAVAGVLALAIGLGVYGLITRSRARPAAAGLISSLAVLPLDNLSGDPGQQYFADGMTEELIAKLAGIESLRVISRTSVMEYKGKKKALPQIAKELNVDAIIEGSVLQAGGQVRITAQLIHGPTDRHLWAQSYQRDLRDVLTLQSEVASAIAQEIQVKLTPQDESRLAAAPSVHPDAYQAYLRGREYASDPDYSEKNMRLAVEMFKRAVELDPQFALAYAGLSRADSLMLHFGYDNTEERLKEAKAAVDRAFQLQPGLPEAHEALGRLYYSGYRDYPQALKEYAIAARDRPNNAALLRQIAAVKRRQGNFQETIEHLQRVLELDPRDANVPYEIGLTCLTTRRYPESERYFDLAISIAPDTTDLYGFKALNYVLWNGATEKSRATLEKMPEKYIGFTWYWFWQEIYERQYEKALNRLASATDEPFKSPSRFILMPQLAGLAYRFMNEPKKAGASFQTARVRLEKELETHPDDARVHASLGIVYGGLGQKQEAIREGKLAIQLYPVSKDAFSGPNHVETLAFIYVMTGEWDAALDQLDYLLSIPSWISVSLLKLDPRWDPLRSRPRFQKLLQKYS